MDSDPEVFTALFQRSYRTIYAYIYRRVSDRSVAEDLAAETFAIAWEKHRGGTVVTVGWLLKTARNLIGNEYQRRDREQSRQQDVEIEELEALESTDEDLARVEIRAAMARLRPPDALVLQLTYWDGLSAGEAAQYLGCSTGALWVRLTRARAALRRELRDEAEPDAAPSMLRDGEQHG